MQADAFLLPAFKARFFEEAPEFEFYFTKHSFERQNKYYIFAV